MSNNNNGFTSPYAGSSAVPTQVGTTPPAPPTPKAPRVQVGSELYTKYQAGLTNLSETKASELSKVLTFLNNSFGSHQILAAAQIDVRETAGTFGQVLLTIPKDHFFTTQPGYYQLRLSWPELNAQGHAVVKVTLNYRIGADGNNVLLAAGGGNGDNSGWTNINSQVLPIQDMIEADFFADAAIPAILAFVRDNLGMKTILTLTPQSDVVIALRNTIVPTNAATNGRNIPTTRAPGEDVGIGMALVYFQGCTLLPKLSGLMHTADSLAKVTAPMSFDALLAKYGGAPVAQPDLTLGADLSVATNNPLSAFANL
jgi:hypothetical protein